MPRPPQSRSCLSGCLGLVNQCLTCFIDNVERVFDVVIFIAGPIYVIVAWVLIGGVAFVYFTAVLPLFQGPLVVAAVHWVLGLWLITNIFWNYALCVFTNPSNTLLVDNELLEQCPVVTQFGSIRNCNKCNRNKPYMSHHCHICKKCVLRMDHHCPWMNTIMIALHITRGPSSLRREKKLIFCMVMSAAVSISLFLLLAWHVYLVLTAQTTIDVYQNKERAAEARRRGQRFVNAFDLGMKRNWQECFDVHGKWWWLAWMLPPTKPKIGNGVVLPTIYHEPGGRGIGEEETPLTQVTESHGRHMV
eukprot:CAMPEP_0117692336 /NCGR_PEP_ID=MMETSP0804-20121206/26273_1 /TAXON_ID=1074897 /ORGANISM="Tetraselmis astigmatica, Strain CCMP880" /LENGTH=303 /DNA_ID=CAMNT_0005505777 /DNA_START=199 /DNA_END=1110 /DNA_ORIENTATION=+